MKNKSKREVGVFCIYIFVFDLFSDTQYCHLTPNYIKSEFTFDYFHDNFHIKKKTWNAKTLTQICLWFRVLFRHPAVVIVIRRGGGAISPPFAKSLAKYNQKRRHIFQWVVALELSLQKCHKTYVLKYNYRTYMFFFTHSINQKYVDIFRNWR